MLQRCQKMFGAVLVVLLQGGFLAADDSPGPAAVRTSEVPVVSRPVSPATPLAPAASGGSNVIYLKPGKPIAGVSSSFLMQRAWKAFEQNDVETVFTAADECVTRYAVRAQKQQTLLKAYPPREKVFNYAALNDVATCLFIKAKTLRKMRRDDEAKVIYQEIVRTYRFAQCWDPKGWFWQVDAAAQDEIWCMEYDLDFGDYTSQWLTMKAWKAYTAGRHEAVELYVRKCLDLYTDVAKQMQTSLNDFPARGHEYDFWALNDVATCLFIRGKSLQRQKRYKEAVLLYKEILKQYNYAQCWDPKGWFWKLKDEAKKNLAVCSS